MSFTKKYKRFPRNLTKFKTPNYTPKDHFTIPIRWDNFTMHALLWKEVLDHFFSNETNLKFLELGSGNGLCANFLLDHYNCHLDTVDMHESHIIKIIPDGIEMVDPQLEEEVNKTDEDNKKYLVSTIKNLQPFIDNNRCNFYNMSTKEFLLKNQDKKYDFIYIDASHDSDWVLYDAVNSFSLLKEDGLMIFDDYGMHNCAKGVNAFLSCFESHIEIIHKGWQVMLHKTSRLQIGEKSYNKEK